MKTEKPHYEPEINLLTDIDFFKRFVKPTAMPAKGEDPQEIIYATSDGRTFSEPHYQWAVDWERKLRLNKIFIKKYNQKKLPDWLYFVAQPTRIDPLTLQTITFRAAYVLDIKEITEQTAKELMFLHPLLEAKGYDMKVTMAKLSPGKIIVVYTRDHDSRLHESQADDIIFRKAEELAGTLRQMLTLIETL
jgi:hypothetical protein